MYFNALTRSVYSPKNQEILAGSALLSGSDSLEVAGFKQWLELGRCVAKGQHGTKILMVCEKKGEAPADGSEPGKYRVCKTRSVFFKSQTVEIGAPLANQLTELYEKPTPVDVDQLTSEQAA